MNYGRVILGGLVAGLIMNIGEFVLNGSDSSQRDG